jgi:hypothetical protein
VQSTAVAQWSTINKNIDNSIFMTTTTNDTMEPIVGGSNSVGGIGAVAMSGTQKVYLRFHVVMPGFKTCVGAANLTYAPYNGDLGGAIGFSILATNTTGLYRNPGSAQDNTSICSPGPSKNFIVNMAYDQFAGLVWFDQGSGWNDLMTPPQNPNGGLGGAAVAGGPWNYIAANSFSNTDYIQGLFTDTTGMPSGYSLPPAV